MKARTLLACITALFLSFTLAARAADQLLITEFMAANDGIVLDEDGDSEDWIELHNAGTNVVNLDGWFLTDKNAQPTQWRFPATNLPPNGYLVVFASGKNRRVPGATLHTNFKLDNNGEYLALIQPDGVTVASAFAPAYPFQISGVSHGFPVVPTVTTLLPTGAVARVHVPLDGSLEPSWALPGFNDSSWSALPTGVGYETDGLVPFVPATMANSVTEFSGTQGQNNWFYGSWDQKADADGIYADSEFTPFPNAGGGWSAANFFNGSIWDWFAGDPPFTQLTGQGGRPSSENGNAALPDHWVVRRYVNEFDGPLTISGSLTHTSGWVYVTQTGVAGTGLLYLYLRGAGEGYIDDIKLVAGAVPESGANLISNGDFESGVLTPWNVTANMSGSSVSSTIRHGGARSMRMVATAAGTTQTDSIWQAPAVSAGSLYTLSYWYLPVVNGPDAVVRASGNWLYTTPDAPGDGVVARIFVDGVEQWQRPAFVSGENYSVTVPAHLGSKIDFALEAGPANNDLGDTTTFTASVVTADPTVQVVADSIADWSVNGMQGEKNWTYGYYFEGTTTNTPTYYTSNFVAFPRDHGPYGPNNFWKGDSWKWFNGNPPVDEIGRELMMPTGLNNLIRHWVIRRWTSTVSGRVTITWRIVKVSNSGAGVTARVLQNGVQRDQAIMNGQSGLPLVRTVVINNVQVGDIFDIALDPTGLGGAYGDGGDQSYVSAVFQGTPSLTNLVASSLQGPMRNVNATAYLRLPFNVANPALVQFLTLRMKYDDGFAAYLNGQLVASANAPGSPDWNSAATVARSDADATVAQDFNLTPFAGLLQPGTNVLAIRGLNASAGDSDFLILPELLATSVAVNTNTPRYFTQVTPGTANGAGTGSFGPIIRDPAHAPNVPRDQDDLHVTAIVLATVWPVDAVSLTYRVMYSNEVTVPMFDDGAHGDGLAGDGVFGATIPASASQPGQMVRYFVYATDIAANASRVPAFDNPQDSPAYFGTLVADPTQTNKLPVLHVFTANPTQTTNYTGTRCSIFYDGEFYDNVVISLHGQTTAAVFWKQSLDISMNRGETFRWKRGVERVDSFNLLSPISDKAYLRQIMAYETFANAGIPGSTAFPLRVQQNGVFYGVFHFVEKGDEHLLERAGLDPDGALYKLYLPMTSAYMGVAEKKTRQAEDYSDLQELINGCNLTGEARRQFIYDNIDVPEFVNFLATVNLVQNEDCCYYKNYFLYRDSNGTKEWQMLPWDLDLTFGRTFGFLVVNGVQTNGYFNTNIFWTNLYYLQKRPSPIGAADFIGQDHVVAEALWSVPEIYQMFLRRWTSVHEQFLQKPGTHPLLLHYERRTDELAAQIEPDAALDLAKWGSWFPVQTMSVAVDILKKIYFEKRRGWIFNTLTAANGGPYLGTQPTNAALRFGAMEPNPSGGNQDQEYVELVNTNSYAVDISGWRVTGAIDHTFKNGVVIPSNSVLYLSPNVNAFRARTSGPRGGLGLFVQGNYSGRLNARGEALQLVDSTGRAVAATNVPAAPSLAQQYLRITEIMYRPTPPPPGLAALADAFEFLELKNIGPAPLNLLGVRLTIGVDFGFTGSSVTNLAPGARVLVVRNLAAFESRYGSGLPVAGQYSGLLDNAGENLRLEDATGEKILDFDYNNAWYPITDGVGFSLVIVNENASWDTWGLKTSWRPGSRERGSPGANNPAADVVAPVQINEVASHTVQPAVDAVELFNPTGGSVNLGGWFLTDDFLTPRKFRIPDLTTISANGHLVFNENHFNPTNPPSPTGFAFSSFGDEVFLFSANAGGELTGYHHGFRFGAAEAGVSFGRHVNQVGAEHFVAQAVATFGGANSYPQVGPVVVSEIHYHPPDFAGGVNNSTDEFIELHNITGGAVPLFHPTFPTNTWRLRGAVDFDFPTNVTLAAGGFALLVSFDPTNATQLAAFRARFNVPPALFIFGPWSGELNNASGEVRLTKPGTPLAGETPQITADEVEYEDVTEWLLPADGHGASWQISVAGFYGHDPFSWIAAAPSPGAAYSFVEGLVITAQPANQIIFGSAPVTFSVGASGGAPLSYQWEFNGGTIPGATGATYSIHYVLPEHAGRYSVTVMNAAGARQSSNALLTVVFGPFFTKNPTNVGTRAGQTAVFTAAAIGSGALTYQWRLNGANAPGTVTTTATNSTLTITNVQAGQLGSYTVLVTDSVGTVPSTTATLTFLVDPTIVLQPVGRTIVAGADVTLSVVVTNTATLPVGFRWRRNGSSIPGAFFVLHEFTNYFVAANIQAPLTNFTVHVTNAARPAGFFSSSAFMIIQADTDADGIPDAWETQFGLAAGDAGDRDLDADGDRMSNWAEFIAGTNPTNGLSYLQVEALTVGGGATLNFGAVSNRTYTVQFTDLLGSSVWFKLGDVPARATNFSVQLHDPNAIPGRYYRLATPQQP